MNLSPEALLLLFAACHFFVVWLVCSPDQTNRADWGIKKWFFLFFADAHFTKNYRRSTALPSHPFKHTIIIKDSFG